MYIYIFIFILVILIISHHRKEMFVAYNTSNIPKFSVDSTYESQTKSLQTLIDNANNKNPYFNNDISLTGYKLYNKNLDFPLANVFKKIVTDYLVKNGVFGKNSYISSDILYLYTNNV